MRSLRFVSLLLIAVSALAAGHGRAETVPPSCVHAVVRVPSHGVSATIIKSEKGKSVLLGCAHGFNRNERNPTIRLDVPVPEGTEPRKADIKLLAVDHDIDLSLILLEDGPLPYVAPVAPPGYKPGTNILSVGYDGMEWPAKKLPNTILGTSPNTTFTKERPGHGRSGGALLDADKGYVIGVVQGYEIGGQRRGLYISHAAILRFLKQHLEGAAPVREGLPQDPCLK